MPVRQQSIEGVFAIMTDVQVVVGIAGQVNAPPKDGTIDLVMRTVHNVEIE